MAYINIFFWKKSKKPINIVLHKQNKCYYPDPDSCSNYNSSRDCCCNPNANCSDTNKYFKHYKKQISKLKEIKKIEV